MRNLIDIIADASHDIKGDVRDLDAARSILTNMSPMDRYRLLDRLPYISLDKGGWDARYRQAVEYISKNMGEFAKKAAPVELRDLDDGGIHRLF
jgi:hypothetical protein